MPNNCVKSCEVWVCQHNGASVSCVKCIFSHASTCKLIKSFLINYLADQNRVDCPKWNGSKSGDWVQLELSIIYQGSCFMWLECVSAWLWEILYEYSGFQLSQKTQHFIVCSKRFFPRYSGFSLVSENHHFIWFDLVQLVLSTWQN